MYGFKSHISLIYTLGLILMKSKYKQYLHRDTWENPHYCLSIVPPGKQVNKLSVNYHTRPRKHTEDITNSAQIKTNRKGLHFPLSLGIKFCIQRIKYLLLNLFAKFTFIHILSERKYMHAHLPKNSNIYRWPLAQCISWDGYHINTNTTTD